MKKQKLTVEVEVWDIKVLRACTYHDGTESGLYTLSYRCRKNGGRWKDGVMDGRFSSQTAAHFKRVLASGYATSAVLQQVYG